MGESLAKQCCVEVEVYLFYFLEPRLFLKFNNWDFPSHLDLGFLSQLKLVSQLFTSAYVI